MMKKSIFLTCAFLALTPLTLFAGNVDARKLFDDMSAEELLAAQKALTEAIVDKQVFADDHIQQFGQGFVPLYRASVDNTTQETVGGLIAFLNLWLQKDPTVFQNYQYQDQHKKRDLGALIFQEMYEARGVRLPEKAKKVIQKVLFLSDPGAYIYLSFLEHTPSIGHWPHIKKITLNEFDFLLLDDASIEKLIYLLENSPSIEVLNDFALHESASDYQIPGMISRILPTLQKMPNLKTIEVPKDRVAMYQEALPKVQVLPIKKWFD